jgi:rhodanese-related sulfurtransferase
LDSRRETQVGRSAGSAALACLLVLSPACSSSEPHAGQAATTSPSAVAAQTPTDPEASTERLLLDLRPPADFAAGHTPGAINLQWSWRQLRDRVPAYVPDRHTPLALQAGEPDTTEAAIRMLVDAGYTNVIAAVGGEPSEVLSVLSLDELESRLASPDPPILIDVRTPGEWKTGTLPGAILLDQDEAPAYVERLDPEAEYAIICEGGYRSSQFASLLRRRGFERVSNVIEGMGAWRRRQ